MSKTFEVGKEREKKCKKFRWLRSNRISPDQLQSEAKSKRLASIFAKGLSNSLDNAWKVYKNTRRLKLIVLYPVPLFFIYL